MFLVLHPGDLLGGPAGLILLFFVFFCTGVLIIGAIYVLYRIAKWNGDRINSKKDKRVSGEHIANGDQSGSD